MLGQSEDPILREAEIRPDYLNKGKAEAFEADLRRLLEFKNDFVHVPCPACACENAKKAFEKDELIYVVCSKCETMYANPRPTPEILKAFYTASEVYAYWNKYIFPASEDARRQKIFRPHVECIADICRRNNIQNGLLLDVGAGFGIFCEEVQRAGLFRRVIAVEPTPDLAESCRRKGLEVIEKPFEQISLENGTIDVIACFEVIEHLFSPRDFLIRCDNLLSPGGLLIVTCPNVKGFDIAVLQNLSKAVQVEHLNYFHPASLSYLMKECGFETLEVLTPGKLDAELVRNKILEGELDVSMKPFLKRVLVDDWERLGGNFQLFLVENLLSSHMWLVARKAV